MTNELTIYDQNYFLDPQRWDAMSKTCQMAIQSGFLPKAISTPQKAVTIVMMGRELGVSPLTALNNISVINGKPVLEAKLMLALVFRKYPDCHYRILENSAEIATVEMGRTKEMSGKYSFTITQARQIGLLSKDNWKNYPADMLLWRAVARACRFQFPDVLTVTAYTQDEIETIDVSPIKSTRQSAKELKEFTEEMEKMATDDISTPPGAEVEVLNNDVDKKETKNPKQDLIDSIIGKK